MLFNTYSQIIEGLRYILRVPFTTKLCPLRLCKVPFRLCCFALYFSHSHILYGRLSVLHTSASLALNENWDPYVRDDMEMMLNKIVPEVSVIDWQSFIHHIIHCSFLPPSIHPFHSVKYVAVHKPLKRDRQSRVGHWVVQYSYHLIRFTQPIHHLSACTSTH